MSGGLAVHERQAILLTTVVISHTKITDLSHLPPPLQRGGGNNHVMLSCKSAIEWALFGINLGLLQKIEAIMGVGGYLIPRACFFARLRYVH